MLKVFKSFKLYDWICTLLLVVFVVGQVWASLEIPIYMGNIMALFEKMKALETANQLEALAAFKETLVSEILKNGGMMLLMSVASIICIIIISFLAAIIGANVAKRLRKDIFAKIQSFSLEELNGFSTASLITRTTNDVTQVSQAIQMGLRFLVQMPVTIICAAIKIASRNYQLSMVVVIAVISLLLMVMALFILVVPRFSGLQKLIDKVNGAARENLTGLRVVRAYNAEGYQQEKFEKTNKSLTKTHLYIDRVFSVFDPFVMLIMNGVTLALWWLGSTLVAKGQADMGVITEFMGFGAQIIMAFLLMTMAFVFIPRGIVSAKRINAVLDKPLKIIDGEGVWENTDTAKIDADGQIKPKIEGEIEFKNVSFKYPDAEENILYNINFKAHKGQTVAFIGSTGSGKSTLVKLVPRFYDVSEGEILVNGEDVRKYKQKQLRDKIGYVPQRGVLFSGTIKSNIIYGDTIADDAAMEKAAQIAQAAEFIETKSEKYDDPISQGGTNVSGGQKQRLSIARAVVRNPEIYIFDDSFSALDYKTDRQLRSALKNSMAEATCLIVAQRVGTIMHADKIIVLDQGRIVGEGTHEELLASCAVYQEIAYSQLGKEELNNGK